MPLIRVLPWIITAIVASIATIVTGVQAGLPMLSWSAAALFCVTLVAIALDVNRLWWEDALAARAEDAPVLAALGNARILMIGYLWGALTLLAIYRLSGLRWQHGVQYAVAMTLMSALIHAYTHRLAQPESAFRRPRWLVAMTSLSLLQGAAALAGIAFLIGSGKIFSMKGDWAANQVFLAGGLAIAALSAIGALAQARLHRVRRDAEASVAGTS